MKRFLFCSTVFAKKQYTVLDYPSSEMMIEKFNYLLNHRAYPVLWPCYTRSDKDELVNMDSSLSSLFKGMSDYEVKECKIKSSGQIYEVYEISRSDMLKGYWKVVTDHGTHHLDPSTITFLGFQHP